MLPGGLPHLRGVGDHGHVDVRVPAHLLLRDDDLQEQIFYTNQIPGLKEIPDDEDEGGEDEDDLGGEGVLGVGDGVVHQADTPHHLPRLLHLVAGKQESIFTPPW